MFKPIRRYLHLYTVFVRNCLIRQMEFRLNFISQFLIDLTWILIALAFFKIIYLRVSNIAGWTEYEMLFFLGTIFIIDSFGDGIFFTNLMRLPDYIRTGELDLFLSKPVNPQFFIATRYFDFGLFSNITVAVILVIYAWVKLAIAFSWVKILLYILLLMNSLLILYSIMSIFMVISFWTIRTSMFDIYVELGYFMRRPGEIYSGIVKFVLIFILPMIVIASFPAKVMVGTLSFGFILWAFTISGVFFILNNCLWKLALKRYESASS